jgi:hypothetical protein
MSTSHQGKKRQKKLHQTKMLLGTKGNNQQSEEVTCKMGKDICKPYIQQGINT